MQGESKRDARHSPGMGTGILLNSVQKRKDTRFTRSKFAPIKLSFDASTILSASAVQS